jgi:hypothetical protein
MARRSRSHKHSRKCGHSVKRGHKQRGGGPGMGQYGFTGPAGMSAAGVPLDSRGAWYSHCGWDNARSAVPDIGRYMTTQFGGSRKQRKAQKGGACAPCSGAVYPPEIKQSGGGGGTGGYSTILNNVNGKTHDGYLVAPCGPAPRETQIGGAASSPAQIVSYSTGYGYAPSSVVSTSSAHYLDQIGYNKTCSGGARRTRRGRKGRKSRRQH